jgi:hypothetical protein
MSQTNGKVRLKIRTLSWYLAMCRT